MQKRPRKANACWAVWVATEIFLVATEFLVLCCDLVLCVATWFLGCRRLLGHDRGFPSHNRVVFLLFFYRDPTVSRKCFVFIRDNVATEVPLS